MEAVAYMLIGAALYAAGGLSIWVAYRSGRDDAHDERDRWEEAEFGLLDVAPASVPEPGPRIVTGGWTPPQPQPTDDREQMYSLDRGPAPTPKPKTRRAPRRAQKARAA